MNAKRKKIGVDVDGVLIDTNEQAYLNFCEQELGWNIDYEIFHKTHSWYKATGQTSSEVLGEAFTHFLADVEEVQRPIEGAHDALKKIGKVADIFLITARVGALREITEDFLQAHLSDVSYREISMGNVENKAQRIIDFGVEYFIDDSHREISLILQNKFVDTRVIPFPAFHGVSNWEDVRDERIHWLPVWKDLRQSIPLEKQPKIHKRAWEQIAEVIQ